MLDESSDYGLSKRRYQRDRRTWAHDEASALYELLSYTRRYWRKALKRKTQGRVTQFELQMFLWLHAWFYIFIASRMHDLYVQLIMRQYVFANEVAASLLAVLQPCPRRARPTCRGRRNAVAPQPAAENPEPRDDGSHPVNVVDDDDVEIITPVDEPGMAEATCHMS